MKNYDAEKRFLDSVGSNLQTGLLVFPQVEEINQCEKMIITRMITKAIDNGLTWGSFGEKSLKLSLS